MPMLGLAQPAAKLPPRNLWVEMRWVESRMDGASLAGVRDGAEALAVVLDQNQIVFCCNLIQ
jgi:hypothetical protein